jgi:hypothetical protein
VQVAFRKKLTSGAEAPLKLNDRHGTTEVVPFPFGKIPHASVNRRACESHRLTTSSFAKLPLFCEKTIMLARKLKSVFTSR